MKKIISKTLLVALQSALNRARTGRWVCLIIILAVAAVAISFSACQTLSTTRGSPPSGSVNGMLYYLPFGKITIKGEFKTLTGADLPDQPAAENETSRETKLVAEPAPPSPPPKPGPEPSGQPGVTTISAGELTITLTSEVEADESAGTYYVTPHATYVYEDETRVTVNSKQLLSTGNVTTEDKTADIAGAVAAIASQAKGLFLVPQEKKGEKKNPPPFYFSFHPSNYADYTTVKNRLCERKIDLKIVPEPLPDGKPVVADSPQAKHLGEKGLIFRPATSYKVILTFNGVDPRTNKSITLIDNTQQFILPDPNRLYEIEYPRMAFVKKVKEIGFTNGMLTDFHQKVPSPILGFLGIPKAIIQAVVPIPGASTPAGSGSTTGTSVPTKN